MQLDAVVTGGADFRRVIDGIAAEAEALNAALRQRPKGAVNLQAAAPAEATSRKQPPRKSRRSAKGASEAKAVRTSPSGKPKRARKGKALSCGGTAAQPAISARSSAPTAPMIGYAEKLAKAKGVTLPAGYDRDFQTCRRFLDQHG